MHVSTRSYLTAGLSLMAVGALIATPMSAQRPQQEPSHPLVRDQQVQLAALATPITVRNAASSPGAVHVLAAVSRAFQSAKTANAASVVEAAPVSPRAARTKVTDPVAAAMPSQIQAAPTGAVSTQGPETADTPGSNAGKSSAIGLPGINGFDPSGIGNVLASAAQLAIDTFIGVPAGIEEQTAFNLGSFFIEVATHNPSMVGDALSDFFANEKGSLQDLGGVLGDDVQQLRNSISHVFGVDGGDDSATVVTAAKTAAKVGATETSQASGAVDPTTAKQHQGNDLGASSQGDVTGKHLQGVSVKPVKGDTTPPKQSRTETKDQPNSNTTEAASDKGSQAGRVDGTSETGTANESATKHNVTKPSGSSETVTKKPGNKPSASTSSQSSSKKTGHTGGQSTGKKSGGTKSHASHGHKG